MNFDKLYSSIGSMSFLAHNSVVGVVALVLMCARMYVQKRILADVVCLLNTSYTCECGWRSLSHRHIEAVPWDGVWAVSCPVPLLHERI